MNKTLTIVVDKEYVKVLDKAIEASRMYSSRSEFLKDAVREKAEELIARQKWRARFDKATKKLAFEAKKKGWNGHLLTREEKIKIADEYLKKKGIKKN